MHLPGWLRKESEARNGDGLLISRLDSEVRAFQIRLAYFHGLNSHEDLVPQTGVITFCPSAPSLSLASAGSEADKMCRICGQMVKCIFDSMPSRAPSAPKIRRFGTVVRQSRHTSSRQLLRTTFSTDAAASYTPPSFLLPHRAKLHHAATVQQEATPAAHFQNTQPHIPPESLVESRQEAGVEELATNYPASSTDLASTKASSRPLVISKSLQELLPALLSQPHHFITTHIHRFPYLLTPGDTLRLPFHLHGVSPGDVLRFNRASIIGSRDYTLKAGLNNSETYDGKRKQPQYLDERLFECRVRVVGLESQPMTEKKKTKRRNRKVKTVRSKHKYTVLKVMEVKVKSLEELKQEKGVVLLE